MHVVSSYEVTWAVISVQVSLMHEHPFDQFDIGRPCDGYEWEQRLKDRQQILNAKRKTKMCRKLIRTWLEGRRAYWREVAAMEAADRLNVDHRVSSSVTHWLMDGVREKLRRRVEIAWQRRFEDERQDAVLEMERQQHFRELVAEVEAEKANGGPTRALLGWRQLYVNGFKAMWLMEGNISKRQRENMSRYMKTWVRNP